MEELIKKAIKALEDNRNINEISLSDGANTVHLVRFRRSTFLRPIVLIV